ncbi:MAG: glycosyltransferase family 39 protein, partial [Pseudomonadota bacterium]
MSKSDGALKRFSASTLGTSLAWAGDRQWRRILLLLPICVAILAVGFWGHGPSDRDEARFAQASKQMLETGDFVDIRFQDDARHKKPAGIYWAQAASASLFGGAEAPIWAYRIPSVLGAILASLLTTWAMRPLIGGRAAFLAGAMTAGLLLLNVEARIAKTDAALLACIVAAQGALARLWFSAKDDPRERGWNVFYFWTAIGLGVLIKGPIIFLPVGGTLAWLLVMERSRGGLQRIGWSWGWIWAALIAAPWFIAIALRSEGGFFAESVGDDMLSKVSSGQEAHGAPPGYYLGVFWGTFWPWTALAAAAVPWAWRWRRAPETAFLLGWIIPTWIVFELVPTKLPHYVLPTYPAICALAAVAVLDGAAKAKGWFFWLSASLWAVVSLALPIAFIAGPILIEGVFVWQTAALGGAALIVFLLAWRWLVAGVWLGFV